MLSVYSFRASVITLNICILLGYLWWCKSSWLSSSLEHLKKEFQSCFTSRKRQDYQHNSSFYIIARGRVVSYATILWRWLFKKGYEKARLTYWGNVTSDVNIIVQESSWMYDGSLYTVTRAFVWKVVGAGAIKIGGNKGALSPFGCV